MWIMQEKETRRAQGKGRHCKRTAMGAVVRGKGKLQKEKERARGERRGDM